MAPPHCTLFPYTTLFRSVREIIVEKSGLRAALGDDGGRHAVTPAQRHQRAERCFEIGFQTDGDDDASQPRSEEHTSELQSRQYLVCRLLLEKKKNNKKQY